MAGPVKKKPFRMRLSHSAIATFKRCPEAWRIAYLWGIRPKETTESLYDGTNWHDGLEILSMPLEGVCRRCADKSKADPDCGICQGTTFLVGEPMEAVARCLERAYGKYGNMSPEKAEKMETRRTILLYSLAAYQWYYSEDDTVKKVLAPELPFDTVLVNSVTGKPFPNIRVVGKIDKYFEHRNGKRYVLEHKSTTSNLDDDSDYWNKLRFDPQTTMYPWAMRDMQAKDELLGYGVKDGDTPLSGVLYDVWKKPKIKPKKIDAARAKEMVTTGIYCDESFTVEAGVDDHHIVINGEITGRFPAAKGNGFQIKETQAMFGARLLQVIVKDPEIYFQRKEISRTTEDLAKFEQQMVNITRTMRHMVSMDCFYCNSTSCDDFGSCDSKAICYNDLAVGPDDVPTGYEKIYDAKGDRIHGN